MLLDLASHVVDQAVQVLGPVTSVTAQVAAVSTPADDDAVLFCRHAGGGRGNAAAGATSLLWVSSVQPAPGPRLRVVGTAAAYVWDDFEDELAYPDLRNRPGCAGWVVTGETRRPAPLPAGGPGDFYRAVARALQAGPAGDGGYVARQAAMPVDPADAVHTLAVIDAARLSAARSREVPIDS